MDALFQPVANLKGIGTKRPEALEKLGIRTPLFMICCTMCRGGIWTTATLSPLRRHLRENPV